MEVALRYALACRAERRRYPHYEHHREMATVAEGLRCVAEADDEVQLALVDMNLPDGSGLDVIRSLRQQRPDVPALVVSSLSSERSVLDAIGHGARGYLHKSEPVQALTAGLQQVLQAARQNPDAMAAQRAAEAARADVRAADRAPAPAPRKRPRSLPRYRRAPSPARRSSPPGRPARGRARPRRRIRPPHSGLATARGSARRPPCRPGRRTTRSSDSRRPRRARHRP